MRVRYTPRARGDLNDIDAYLRTKSQQGARNVRERLQQACSLLGRAPRAGRESDFPGIRVVPLVTYPYLIYFRVRDNQVHIIHVRHGARQSPSDLQDLT